MRIREILGCALAFAVLVGCGDDAGDTGLTADTLEQDIAAQIRERNNGSTITEVRCVAESDNQFVCQGQFHASRAYAERTMRAIDTSDFRAVDWDVIIQQYSGPVSYDVTIDPDTDEFVATPR